MQIQDIVDETECLITRMWGFSPETWGAVGFPNPGTARKWLAVGKPLFVVSFVSHHAADHIREEERGRVLGIYEIIPELVSLETDDVLDPMYLADPALRREDGAFRWPVGLRASRAWRFQPQAPWTRQALPDARTLGREVSTDMVRISTGDYALLRQYRLAEVEVYGVDFSPKRISDPVAAPDHVYAFSCAKPDVLHRLPGWRPGEILVKIGCASDVDARLNGLNDDPIAKIFHLRLSKGSKRYVGKDEALRVENDFLLRAKAVGRPACDLSTEFFFMTPKAYEKLMMDMTRALTVA
jgi:hypothetical protein